MAVVGVISDTHGLVRAEAVEALKGVELILHAGDVGGAHVLEELGRLAPVLAVRGNNDSGSWAEGLPPQRVLEIEGIRVYMLHDLKELDLAPATGFRVVVSGHSHKPSSEERGGTLYLNPGSAGPRRFSLPVGLARMILEGGSVSAELIQLLP